MSDTSLNKIIQYGTNAERIAFTPDPAASSQVLYIWYETDNAPDTYVWDGGAWVQINAADGLNQLTGDVTAGPGTGSQAATLANSGVTANSYINAIITVDAKGRITAAANGNLWTYVTKTIDQSIDTNTTPATDSELFFTMAATTLYMYEAFIIFASPLGGGTPDFKFQFNGPATFTGASLDPMAAIGTSGAAPGLANRVGPAAVAIGTAATPSMVRSMGWCYSTSGGSGSSGLAFQWSQNTSSANPTIVYAGSFLRYKLML